MKYFSVGVNSARVDVRDEPAGGVEAAPLHVRRHTRHGPPLQLLINLTAKQYGAEPGVLNR